MKKFYRILPDTAGIIFGVFVMWLGLSLVIPLSFNVNIGGFMGLSQVFAKLFDIPYTLSHNLLNVLPFVYLLLQKEKDWKLIIGSIPIILVLSALLDNLVVFDLPPLLSLILGLALIGLGDGIIVRYDCSSGGVTTVGVIIAGKTNLTVGRAMFLFDATVILAWAFVVGQIWAPILSIVAVRFISICTDLAAYKKTILLPKLKLPKLRFRKRFKCPSNCPKRPFCSDQKFCSFAG